jgi:aminoglycoside phosphotransferase (APT) family kinase protein
MAEPLVDEATLPRGWTSRISRRSAPVTIRITTGHSNEVFRVGAASSLQLLRRRHARRCHRPHDMAREFRVLTAFHGGTGWNAHAPVPVPDPIALCTDADVIGAPFYLMRVVDGIVVRESLPAVLATDPEAARHCGYALIDALAGIHAFDWHAGGLNGFGRPDGYLERQVARWLGQLEKYKTRPLPGSTARRVAADRVPAAHRRHSRRLQARQRDARAAPRRDRGGCRLGAVDGRDPLDVGWVLGLWAEATDPRRSRAWRRSREEVTCRRSELLDRYAQDSRRDLSNVNYYCVLGLFKLACVMEGSYARFRAGTSDDAYFASLERGVPALARRALEFAHGDQF